MNKGVQELNLVTSYFNDPKKMHIHKRIPFIQFKHLYETN